MSGDRVLVPLRGVLEQMGARVDWNPSTQTVSAWRGKSRVKLAIGQNTAAVNGQPVNLDVPAQILNGSTMVPLRFVGEALGANVHWDNSSDTVTISGGDYQIPPQPNWHRPQHIVPSPAMFEAGTVIPVSFNITLGSGDCQPGQTFTTVVNHYPGIPDGSRIEGVVQDVAPAGGGRPGAVEFAFNTLITPTGHKYSISGQAVPLNDPSIARTSNGKLIARGSASSQRFVFANEAGAPKLVHVNSRESVHNPNTLKEIANKVPSTHNVQLTPGTKFGIRLNMATTIK
jgi:hypothetical protein